MKIQKIVLTVWLVIGMVTVVKAQQQKTDTVSRNTLSRETGMSKDNAADLKAAFNYNKDKIEKLLKDNTVPAAQKMRPIMVLLAERNARVAALHLSEEQLSKLKQQQAEGIQAARVWHDQIRQQNEATLSRSAVKVTDGNSKTDSLKSVDQ